MHMNLFSWMQTYHQCAQEPFRPTYIQTKSICIASQAYWPDFLIHCIAKAILIYNKNSLIVYWNLNFLVVCGRKKYNVVNSNKKYKSRNKHVMKTPTGELQNHWHSCTGVRFLLGAVRSKSSTFLLASAMNGTIPKWSRAPPAPIPYPSQAPSWIINTGKVIKKTEHVSKSEFSIYFSLKSKTYKLTSKHLGHGKRFAKK